MLSSMSLCKQWSHFQSKVSLLVSTIKSPQLIFRCNYSDEGKANVRFTSLCHRSIVQVSGKDSIDFLQGLFTNDVTKLAKEQCMYTMMLNNKGRVDHDILMYMPNGNDNRILLDCQTESVDKIIKTFKLFKLRKKIDISVREDYSVWQMQYSTLMRYPIEMSDKVDLSQYFSPNIFFNNVTPYRDDAIIACNQDPRLSWLGWRIIATSNPCEDHLLKSVDAYHSFRYFFGIPEGPIDLLPGKSLPFESNLDFMNGVSFHKGCYLGQELTARSHFTGTIRKRLMPLIISSRSKKVIENNANLFDNKGNNVGKFRSTHDNIHGMGLIKLDRQAISLNTVHGIKIKVNETFWWPK